MTIEYNGRQILTDEDGHLKSQIDFSVSFGNIPEPGCNFGRPDDISSHHLSILVFHCIHYENFYRVFWLDRIFFRLKPFTHRRDELVRWQRYVCRYGTLSKAADFTVHAAACRQYGQSYKQGQFFHVKCYFPIVGWAGSSVSMMAILFARTSHMVFLFPSAPSNSWVLSLPDT